MQFIAIGCNCGETAHLTTYVQGKTQGITFNINLMTDTPAIFCLLTDDNKGAVYCLEVVVH